MNHSQIVSFIWGVADLIRDTFKRGKYQDVILPLTVLRRLDCVLADIGTARRTPRGDRVLYADIQAIEQDIVSMLRGSRGEAARKCGQDGAGCRRRPDLANARLTASWSDVTIARHLCIYAEVS